MLEASFGLLERLHLSSDSAAWQGLAEFHTPYIQSWLSRPSVPSADVEALTREMLRYGIAALLEFQYVSYLGTISRWRRIILVNQLWSFWPIRARQPLFEETVQSLGRREGPASDLSRLLGMTTALPETC